MKNQVFQWSEVNTTKGKNYLSPKERKNMEKKLVKILNPEEIEYENFYKNSKEGEEAHCTKPGWCCACDYDQILLNKRIKVHTEILLEKVQELITAEIAIAHTKDAGGKTSRLTSLFMKVSDLKKKEHHEIKL